MASADKTAKEPTTAELEAARQDEIQAAVTPAGDAPERDAKIKAAQDRELARQKAVEDAVAKANRTELPKLGGTPDDPGLGR